MCNCVRKLMNPDSTFRHYDEKKNVLGSEFDDFGTEIYEDEKGNIHTFFGHLHLGLYESFSHRLSNDVIPKTWKYNGFDRNNSLIPQIREYLKTLPNPEPEPVPVSVASSQHTQRNRNRNRNRNQNHSQSASRPKPSTSFTLADFVVNKK